MKENEYDVIIIGSGAGGLNAGVQIQSKNPGLRTLMFEKNTYPGGSIGGFFKEGFYFDVAAEAILNIEKNRAYLNLTECDFNHTFLKIDPIEAYYDDGRVFYFFSDKQKLLEEVKKHFPDQVENTQRLIETSMKMGKELKAGNFSLGKLSFRKKITVIFKYPILRKYGRLSFKEYLDSFLTNDHLKKYFLIFSLWYGLPIEEIKATIGAGLLATVISGGLFYPEGGMEAFTKKLAELYVARGGTLKYKTEVEKILIENKKAVGVKTKDGTTYSAKYIISNADVKRTVFSYIGKEYFSSNYLEEIRNLKQSITGIMLFLGVKGLDLSQYPAHFHVEVNGNILKEIHQGNFNLEGIAVRIAANKDSGMRTDSKDSLHALCFAPFDWNNYWQAGESLKRGDEYRKLKDELTQKMIKKIEQVIPEISKHIIYKSLSTPLTFERYNLVEEGAWYGPRYNQKLPDFIMPIKNLFLAGGNTGGGGVTAALNSGHKTAIYITELINQEIIKES